jgi:RNA polymerase sigma-70 factor (ECF subfamily)
MSVLSQADAFSPAANEFVTTHWSVVFAAGKMESPKAAAALEDLCRAYWKPLYAYVRRQGHDAHEAQDLTQDFFARLLEKQYLELADPARGRFRTFLLTSMKRFLINDWKRSSRQKRGGGQQPFSLEGQTSDEDYTFEPSESATPERIYEKRWATTLLERVLTNLQSDYESAGTGALFHELKVYVWGEKSSLSYADIASHLGLSEGAVKVAAHRMRQRFRQLLRAEIANTVADPNEVDAELQYLFEVIAS